MRDGYVVKKVRKNSELSSKKGLEKFLIRKNVGANRDACCAAAVLFFFGDDGSRGVEQIRTL